MTVRQVVHHLPDSHMTLTCASSSALTESVPNRVKITVNLGNRRGQMAELADSRSTPIETSLVLLESLHSRWVVLLRSLKPGRIFAKAGSPGPRRKKHD